MRRQSIIQQSARLERFVDQTQFRYASDFVHEVSRERLLGCNLGDEGHFESRLSTSAIVPSYQTITDGIISIIGARLALNVTGIEMVFPYL